MVGVFSVYGWLRIRVWGSFLRVKGASFGFAGSFVHVNEGLWGLDGEVLGA